jgi:hypothetical protein
LAFTKRFDKDDFVRALPLGEEVAPGVFPEKYGKVL